MNIRNGIDQINPIFPSPSTQAGNASQGVSGLSQDPVAADRAQLSTVAGHLATSASESDVRVDKVARVQNALLAGTYQVPAEKVAEKVISAMISAEG